MNLSTGLSTLFLFIGQYGTAVAYLWCTIACCAWVFQQFGLWYGIGSILLHPMIIVLLPPQQATLGNWSLMPAFITMWSLFSCWCIFSAVYAAVLAKK